MIAGSGAVAALRSVWGQSPSGVAKTYRVGVIGHTGRGNYGHGLDKVWLGIPSTAIVAVADPDPAGRAKAEKDLGGAKPFADYREMLREMKPEIVAVCPRQPDQHAEMILAAIEAGARALYVEKPFVRSLEEADAVREACRKSGARLAAAHRNRYHPDLAVIDAILRNEGEMKIGRLLEIRGRGKSDRRGGGEDLWVLGTHVLNLMAFFAGPPVACSAVMFQGGNRVNASHIQPGNEALGPLAGDEIHARYEFESGIVGYFESMAEDGTRNQGFGLQLIGSEGVVLVRCDARPLAHFRKGNPFDPANASPWQVIGNTDQEKIEATHHHRWPCQDLIEAMEQDREPLCGIDEAVLTVEMVMAVFASHMNHSERVAIPLKNRHHPLAVEAV